MLYKLTGNSILIDNSEFSGATIGLNICSGTAEDCHVQCNSSYCIKLSKVTLNSLAVAVDIPFATEKVVLLEDLVTSSSFPADPRKQLFFNSSYDSSKEINDSLFHATLCNVKNNNVDVFLIHVSVSFVNCIFENNADSAIRTIGSVMIFQGKNIFRNNSAYVGAAIVADSDSYMYIRPHTSILFEDNHAGYAGGAIYSANKCDPNACFFYIYSGTSTETIEINFVNNTANFAGSSLYGGGIHICILHVPYAYFHQVFNVSNTELDPSAIAADSQDLCFCEDGKNQPAEDCDGDRVFYTDAYPGQEFPIRLAIVGSRFNGAVSGSVRAYEVSPQNALGPFQTLQVFIHPCMCYW